MASPGRRGRGFGALGALALTAALLVAGASGEIPIRPCFLPCSDHAKRDCWDGYFCWDCQDCSEYRCGCFDFQSAVAHNNNICCNYDTQYRVSESTPLQFGNCSNLTVCGNGTYMAVNHTQTTDRVCGNAVNCTGATPFQLAPPTATTGRRCTSSAASTCTRGVNWAYSLATATTSCKCSPVTDCFSHGAWTSTPPTTSSNARCTAFTDCLINGTYSSVPATPTADVSCDRPLTTCVIGRNYESVAPTITSDRECGHNITNCIMQNYSWSKVLPTSTTNVVCKQPVQDCSYSDVWQAAAPTYTSDRVCVPTCNLTVQYALPPVPPFSSRGICTPLSTCGFELQTVAPTRTTDRQCGTRCSPGDFVGPAVPPGSSGGACTRVTNCSADNYQTHAATATSNRECHTYTNCTAIGRYSSAPLDATADVTCNKALTVCKPTEVQTAAPTITTDRKCSTSPHASGLSTAQYEAIGGGASALVLLVAVVVAILWRRQKKKISVQHSIELDALMDRDAEREATVQRMLAAWQIPEDHITFERKLDEGAYSVVFQGVWGSQPVAIKVLKTPAIIETTSQEFAKECETLLAIKHPNLLVFFGAGTTKDRKTFYMVTEYMAGGSLRNALEDPLRIFEWFVRVRIATQVACGVEYLHKLSIVHRDLKSDNCLLDADDNAKVADFGTSRILAPRRRPIRAAETGNPNDPPSGNMTRAAGTLYWMAPEVFFGATGYDTPVDVYSFGIILWELATRKMPWHELDATNILEQFDKVNTALREGRRPELPASFSDEHPEFTRLMHACWATSAGDRPTFSEIVVMLDAILEGVAPPSAAAQFCHSIDPTTFAERMALRVRAGSAFHFMSVQPMRSPGVGMDDMLLGAPGVRVGRSRSADSADGLDADEINTYE